MKRIILSITFYLSFSYSQILQYNNEYDVPYKSGEIDRYSKKICLLDIYYPTNIKNFKTIVWFHGGGLKTGDKTIPEEMKNRGVAVISVGYRLYPEVKCPGYIQDAAEAVAWVFKNIKKYGGNKSKIFVAGHSAGGYLALMIGLDKKWLENYNCNADSIAGLISFSGQTVTHSTIREERTISDKQPIIDEFAPLYNVRKDTSPIILITGGRKLDLPARYEENVYLESMLKYNDNKLVKLYEVDGFDHMTMLKPGFELLFDFVNK